MDPTDVQQALVEALRAGDPHYLAAYLTRSTDPAKIQRAVRKARDMMMRAWRRNPRVAFLSSARRRAVIDGFECQGYTPGWRRAIQTALRRIRRSSLRDWNRLRSRVLGFDVAALEPGTVGEFANGFQASTDESFLPPGIVRLSLRSRPSALVVAHECGHAVTTLAEWRTREREIDVEWASEGCANRYVLKWGFNEQAVRRIASAQLGHMGGVPGDVITVARPEGERRYRIARDFHYRAL